MDMDISSDFSSLDEDTAIGTYWDSIVGLPFMHRPCVRRGILDLELFSYRYMILYLIECCRYTWEIRPVYT